MSISHSLGLFTKFEMEQRKKFKGENILIIYHRKYFAKAVIEHLVHVENLWKGLNLRPFGYVRPGTKIPVYLILSNNGFLSVSADIEKAWNLLDFEELATCGFEFGEDDYDDIIRFEGR